MNKCDQCKYKADFAGNYIECVLLHRFVDYEYWHNEEPEGCQFKAKQENNVRMSEELKPCPFCGREVRLVNVSEVGFKCDIWVIVHEEKEPICFLWHNKGYEGKKKDIVKLWNQRI